MYKHFEPSQRIFVDREEYIEWMDEALKRCREKSVVLHLRGIGGIGKSSLFEHWKKTVEATIVLDCQQYTEFYDRLNIIAKEAVMLGIPLQRFDVLWQIRQRFVQGVEPVKESGREWAKEVISAIPFIGSLVSIGSAISTVGAQVAPKLKERFGTAGKWLQETLGKNHVERLLEILWRDPHHAEFLYLDALLEDINNRKDMEKPILFLLDHFEYMDAESTHWRYDGKEIAEPELWRVFLSSLTNSVAVMASRRAIPNKTEIKIEESELTELERKSCIELLELRQITHPGLQDRIVSVSGGNPFVIGTICDVADAGTLSLESIENLRADTLEDVRLKTWRRLFSQVQDLQGLVNRAGIVPFFDRRVLNIIAPEMDSDQWSRLIHLSFIRNRGDGTFTLHNLARDLIFKEMEHRIAELATEAANRLEGAFEKESDYALLGLSVAVRSLASEREAITKLTQTSTDLMYKGALADALTFHEYNRIYTLGGHACRIIARGWIFTALKRVVEAERDYREVMSMAEHVPSGVSDDIRYWVAEAHAGLGSLYIGLDRLDEAEEAMREGIRRATCLNERTPGYNLSSIALMRSTLGDLLHLTKRYGEAEVEYREALEIQERVMNTPQDPDSFEGQHNSRMYQVLLAGFANVLLQLGKADEAEELARKALEIEGSYLTDFFSKSIIGTTLKLMNRVSEAEAVFSDFVSIGRTLVEKDTQLKSYLVDPLVNLGILLLQVGKFAEAEELLTEAQDIAEEVFEEEPERGKSLTALSLRNLADFLSKDGRFAEANNAYSESLEFYRQAAELFPNRYKDILCDVLNSYAINLNYAGKTQEAEKAYNEALEISKQLVHDFPEAVFLEDLQAVVLNNLGVLLRNKGRSQEALKSYREAIERLNPLADKSPDLFLHHYATILNNLGVALSETGKNSEAEENLNECLRIRRDLRNTSEELFLPGIASCLNNIGLVMKRDGQQKNADEAFKEAAATQEESAAKGLGIKEVFQEGIWSEEEMRASITYFWIY
ncbi:MAG: tetratricopeptide repeat protein [Candidatus Thorarchaeota archaeon]